jgi:hypothetical protein
VGLYAVRLYVNGRARIVVVDDNIPYHTMLHAMTYSLDKREYWIQLLEKAWAKLHGSYCHIVNRNSILPATVYSMLTNNPSSTMVHSKEDPEIFWFKVKHACRKNSKIVS